MKAIRAFLILAAVATAALPAADPAALLPDLDGWSRDGAAATFRPDNLYVHIDGAAEAFLAYGFQSLAVQNYANAMKQGLSAEIYCHGTPENAFGIYGSERPLAGTYLAVGSQGYAEEGVLNFISDAYYVKLNGFDLGPGGAAVLEELAGKIVAAINGRNALPAILAAFPGRGKVAHSERFILSQFLGHEFLGTAYTADYEAAGEKFQLFVMRTKGEAEARAMLQRWAALDRERAGAAVEPGDLGFRDPYNGPLRIGWRGALVWGSLGRGEAVEPLLKELGANLAALD